MVDKDGVTLVKGSKKRTFQHTEQDEHPSDGANKIGLVDLQKLEYSARTLQKSIRLIIDAPDTLELEKLTTALSTDPGTKAELQQNRLVHLASKLKTIYKIGKLGIFDEIINADIKITDDDIVKLKKVDKNISKIEVVPIAPSLQTMSLTGVDGTKPPLPRIRDPQLYERVFIHKSTINSKSYLEQKELSNMHNERLEFLGDSVLNNLATLIIYERFPDASEGQLTKIRSQLIDNRTLSEFSFEYGLNNKLRTNISDEILKTSDRKIYADIFEAYVGALALERGLDLDEVKQWLANLYEYKLVTYDSEFTVQPLNKEAKTELYSIVGSALFHPTYEVIKQGDGTSSLFIIECRMGNDVLGRGTAPGAKDAGLRAAMNALTNKPLLEKYHKIRMETDRKDTVKSHKRIKLSDEDDQDTPRAPRSPINASIFPIPVNQEDPLDADARNKLYAEVGKRIGETPKYEVSKFSSTTAQVDLVIRGITVASMENVSKKKGMTRVAMALINNREALDEICKEI